MGQAVFYYTRDVTACGSWGSCSPSPRPAIFCCRGALWTRAAVVESAALGGRHFWFSCAAFSWSPDRSHLRCGHCSFYSCCFLASCRARLRWVRLGKTFGERTEVISGLEPGDRVAVSGLDRLSDGSPVEVKDDA